MTAPCSSGRLGERAGAPGVVGTALRANPAPSRSTAPLRRYDAVVHGRRKRQAPADAGAPETGGVMRLFAVLTFALVLLLAFQPPLPFRPG